MNCSLSGEVPQDPVVSRVTGHIFERRLIEKHLASSNTCPITGGELSTADLIAVKADRTVPPRDVAATSIPGMLSLFQKEWDANMLETFTLRKNVQTLRQELSQALYMHDAACRVIARLVKERDQAVAAYQDVQSRAAQGGVAPAAAAAAAGGGGGGGGGGAVAAAPSDGSTVPAEALAAMQAKAEELKALRIQRGKKRAKPATLASKEQVASFQQTSSHTPHQAGKPGITCVAIHAAHQNVVATGGVDKNLKVFDRNTKKVTATVTGHAKKVTAVAWHPTQAVLFSGSEDHTVRVWAAEGKKYPQKAIFADHTAAVTGVAVHPTGAYVASSSLDGSWMLHDCAAGTTVTTAKGAAGDDKGLTAVAFHPDGLILGTGAGNGAIALWDMTNAGAAQRTLEGHTAAVTSLHFSENGYSMVSASVDGTVRLWDLRKLACVKTLEVGSPVHSARFDHSGTYLAVGATDTRVLHVKSWSVKATFTQAKGSHPVLGVALTNDAQVVASVGMDRALRFYGVK